MNGMKIGGVMFFTTYSMDPARLGRELEARSFESLWVPEHTHIPLSRKTQYRLGGALIRPYYDIYDPFLSLNTAAAATTKLKIGTGVCLVNQRDPITTAKMVSTIDQLSNGRFLFGVGVGWNQDEMENHGTVFAQRQKLTRERIEAMAAIWTTDDAEYHGELVNFDTMNQWPKPVQKPYPPIIVGGAFPHGARRAIRYGDGWIPRADHFAKDQLGPMLSQFRQMASEAGRDPASLPVSIFRGPEDIGVLRMLRDIGVDRVVFTIPAEKEDTVLPLLDRWAKLRDQLGAG